MTRFKSLRGIATMGVVAGGLFLLFPTAAVAQGEPEKKPSIDEKTTWPKALESRNARHALLQRGFDEAGDLREHQVYELVQKASLLRRKDRLGDREEVVRYEAGRRGRAVRVAIMRRALDRSGDARETVLARRTRTRRHAALARIKVIPVEEYAILSRYKLGMPRFGSVNGKHRIFIGGRRRNRQAIMLRRNTTERRKEGREGFRERPDKSMGIDRRREHRDPDRTDDELERELDKETEKDERDAERDDEKDDERDEKAEERDDERDEERSKEREEEKSQQKEEETD